MHGCREGRCSACKSYVLDGEIQMENYSTFACNDSEVDDGFVLLCRSRAFSDCTIELLNFDEDELLGGIPIQDVRTEVLGVEPVTRDIVSLRLKPVEPGKFDFKPGQYADLHIPGTDEHRSFSMATTQTSSDRVEFLIKKYPPGGKFSALLDGDIGGRRPDRPHRSLRVVHAQGRARPTGGVHRRRCRHGADPVPAAPHAQDREHPAGAVLLRGTHRRRSVLPRRDRGTGQGPQGLPVRCVPVRIRRRRRRRRGNRRGGHGHRRRRAPRSVDRQDRGVPVRPASHGRRGAGLPRRQLGTQGPSLLRQFHQPPLFD